MRKIKCLMFNWRRKWPSAEPLRGLIGCYGVVLSPFEDTYFTIISLGGRGGTFPSINSRKYEEQSRRELLWYCFCCCFLFLPVAHRDRAVD